MKPTAFIEELERMRPAERLRVFARIGGNICGLGPVEFDFNDFHERMVRHGKLFPDDWNDPVAYREQVHTLHFTSVWAQHGFNVFELTPDLAAGFLLTEPPKIEDELHLPFPCFFVKLPEGVVPIFAHGKQIWAEGIWVHRFTSMHQEHGARTPFFRWSAVRGTLSVWKDRFPGNLEEADENADESTFNRVMWGDPPVVPEDQITTSTALRVVRNLVSWLDATGGLAGHPKPVQPPARRKLSRAKRDEKASGNWPRVWIFGKEVKLGTELKRMAREVALGQSEDHQVQGWKVRIRHVVRGHWKNQFHGEGRSLRKRIWVEPYYRGPEDAAAWAHLYEAGDGEKKPE